MGLPTGCLEFTRHLQSVSLQRLKCNLIKFLCLTSSLQEILKIEDQDKWHCKETIQNVGHSIRQLI